MSKAKHSATKASPTAHLHLRRRTAGLLAAGLLAALTCDAAPKATIPHVNALAQKSFQQYLQSNPHRAFVIAPGGTWVWFADMPSEDLALDTALEECGKKTEQTCVPYAINEHVVFNSKTWPTLWGPYMKAAAAAQAPVGTRRGQRMFDLQLKDPAGHDIKLSDLHGKVVILHFWGSWCSNCRHELPQLNKLHQLLGNHPKIQFVLVQLRENVASAREWLAIERMKLPQFDSGTTDENMRWISLADGSRLADRSLAPVFPSTYILDPHGIVLFSMRGEVHDWAQYVDFLRDAATHSGK